MSGRVPSGKVQTVLGAIERARDLTNRLNWLPLPILTFLDNVT